MYIPARNQRSGGDGGNQMHARIAKLESDVGHIQADVREIKDDLKEIKSDAKIDFRLLFGALIAAAIGLAGLMARGFGWLG
jgi:hypothetical protein